MSRETRTIRPFVGLEDVAGVFGEASLHFGEDVCLADDGITVDIASHEYLLRPVSIEWAADEEAFGRFRERLRSGAKAAGFALDDLAVVVVASSTYLKLAEILVDLALSDVAVLSRVTDLTNARRPRSFSAPFSGFSVDTYLILTRFLEPRALRPYRKGTWLSTTRFQVATSLAPALLPPTPLTDEERKRLSLPARTIRYLYFGDHDPLEPYEGQEQPVFYVDADLLGQMNARRRAPTSKALQLQLAHDFVSAVVRRASASPEVKKRSYADVRASLLGSVIRIAAGPGSTDEDRERLLGDVRESPEYVIARGEHSIDVAAGFSGLFEDGDE